MAYEVINIYVPGPDATARKEEIKKASERAGFANISRFMMALYDEWKKKHKK